MTTVNVPMPKVGELMEQGTVLAWMVEPGTHVDAGDLLVEIVTDKVNYQVESPRSGIVKRIIALPDQVIRVGAPLCELEAD